MASSLNQTTISAKEIQKILDSYRIGKKPLSLLLGWGETTILRYLNGLPPIPEYAKELYRILEQPSYYLELLNQRRSVITEIAYRKTCEAVNQLLIRDRLPYLAQSIINRADGDISALRVQAILYYAQCFSLALYHRPLFEEDCEINHDAFIPYPEIYHTMRSHQCKVMELPPNIISEEEKLLLDQIFSGLEWYGPATIRNVTSLERPALEQMLQQSKKKNKKKSTKALNGVPNDATKKSSQELLSKEALQAYFSDVLSGYGITKPKEINSYFNKRTIEYRKSVKALKKASKSLDL